MVSVYENSDGNRFALGELYEIGKNPLIFIGVNPSTATPGKNDATINKVIAISNAKRNTSWIMLNIYPQIAININALSDDRNLTIHDKNIEVIKSIVKDGSTVVAAWGDHIEDRSYLITCLKEIVEGLNGKDITWKHLGDFTKKGHPRHPLLLSANVAINDFDIKAYIGKK